MELIVIVQVHRSVYFLNRIIGLVLFLLLVLVLTLVGLLILGLLPGPSQAMRTTTTAKRTS